MYVPISRDFLRLPKVMLGEMPQKRRAGAISTRQRLEWYRVLVL